MTSINTNVGALVALRNLNSTSFNLDITQNRVSTGFKITGPKDDASNFSIAQGLRADLKAFDAVQQGLASARGIITVAISGASAVSDLMARYGRVRLLPLDETRHQLVFDDEKLRRRLVAEKSADGEYVRDIVLRGAEETPFFDL